MPADDTPDVSAIFAAAQARASDKQLPLQGLLTPREAWALHEIGGIELIDTRTLAERDLIGYVPGSVHIEWYDYPAKARNAHFLDQLRARVEPDRPWRSCAAAACARSTPRCSRRRTATSAAYNIVEGFEGDKNPQAQRRVNGWQMAGLPWRQD